MKMMDKDNSGKKCNYHQCDFNGDIFPHPSQHACDMKDAISILWYGDIQLN